MRKIKTYAVVVKVASAWTAAVKVHSAVDAIRIGEKEFHKNNLKQFSEHVESTVAFIPRSRIGSWHAFERRFRPIDGPDGALYWRLEQLPKTVNMRLVWTITECDGKHYVVPGFHTVNRIDYLLCSVPWTDQDFAEPGYRYD